MKQPESVDDFLRKMETIRDSKNVAARLLFNHIEEDVTKKEEFIMN